MRNNIIAIINQKGGVGKTTTAVTMSSILSQRGFKTLLIDADPQGNASSSFGYDIKFLDNSLFNLLTGSKQIEEVIEKTKYNNLHLIKSNYELANINLELFSRENREFVFKNIFSEYAKNYDFVIIDSPPSLDILTVNIMVLSDKIVIPIKSDFLSLYGLVMLFKTYKNIYTNFNNKSLVIGIILTMYNNSTKICGEVEKDVKGYVGKLLFNTKIPQNVRVTESPSYGIPVNFYDPKSAGSIKYNEFIDEFLERNTAINKQEV